MLKPSHVNIGATVALSSILLTGGYISIFLAFYPFLALLDDADHHEGTVTKAIGFKLPGAKHRGYSHTLIFNIIVGLGIFYGFKYYYPTLNAMDMYILIAISLSHLCADIFTVRGAPLLSPITDKNFGIPLISTGQGGEKLFTVLFSAINIGLLTTVFIRYILPHTYVVGTYDTKLILIALGIQLFIIYLLLKEEVVNLKGNVSEVIKGVFRIIFSVIMNGVVAFTLFYTNQYLQLVNLTKVASSFGIGGNTFLIILGILCFLPTFATTFKQIDKLSFPFASAVNIFIVMFMIGFFGIKLM